MNAGERFDTRATPLVGSLLHPISGLHPSRTRHSGVLISEAKDAIMKPMNSSTHWKPRPTMPHYLRLLQQLTMGAAALLLLSPQALAATFRFASTSNRIYVENGGSATLSDIKTALPNAPLDLVDGVNAVWLLRANLWIADGVT